MLKHKKIMKVLSRKNGHHVDRKSKLEGMLQSLTALNLAVARQRQAGNPMSGMYDAIDKVDLILKRALARV